MDAKQGTVDTAGNWQESKPRREIQTLRFEET